MAILYTKEYYMRKLRELEDCSEELEKHIRNLSDLLNQIKYFSKDKHTAKHESNLRSLIQKTQSVKVRTDKMIKLYEQTIEELNFGDELINKGTDVIGSLFTNLLEL